MKRHAFQWSPLRNGRGVCKYCGLQVKSAALKGPRGGSVTGYRVKGKWVATPPPCAELCDACGQPMLPSGLKKKPNEYDHASGCPRERKGRA